MEKFHICKFWLFDFLTGPLDLPPYDEYLLPNKQIGGTM